MASAPSTELPESTVTGIPLTKKSIADVRNAIGEACNTPQSVTVGAHHPRSVAVTMVAEGDLESDTPPQESPASSPDAMSVDPREEEDDDEGAGKASAGNSEIDLCRRAVEMPEVEEDVCSICLDEFTTDDPGNPTECGHLFHLQCVMQWAQRSKECPLCFRQLGLKDPDMHALLPFGEYTPPPGVRVGPGMSAGFPANMYGVETWELEQLLQRLAMANQAGTGHSSGHRRHRSHRSRREGETEAEREERHRRRREQRERERAEGHPGRSSSRTEAAAAANAALLEGRYPRQASIPQAIPDRQVEGHRSSESGASHSRLVPEGTSRSMPASTRAQVPGSQQGAATSGANSHFGSKLRSGWNAMSGKWKNLWRGEDSSGPSSSSH